MSIGLQTHTNKHTDATKRIRVTWMCVTKSLPSYMIDRNATLFFLDIRCTSHLHANVDGGQCCLNIMHCPNMEQKLCISHKHIGSGTRELKACVGALKETKNKLHQS